MSHFILFAVLTSLASALHGGDYFGKGKIVAGHAILSLSCGLLAPVGVVFFWFLFRRGKQAQAELGYLSGKTDLSSVQAAYIPFIGTIMRKVIGWCFNNPWRDFGAKPSRRQQEIAGGFVLGLILGVPFVIVPAVIGL